MNRKDPHAPLWSRIARHKDGRPRNWFARLCFDSHHHPTAWGRLLVEARGPDAATAFRRHLFHGDARIAALRQARRNRIDAGVLARARRIAILPTPHTLFLARMLDHLLTPMGFSVRIVDQWSQAEDSAADMWIVIAPYWHRLLPPPERRIAFQVEQFTDARLMTPRFLEDLRASFAVFDYSRANIDHFRRTGLDLASIHHVPLTPVPMTAPSNPPRGGEVLFYGEARSPRRAECLAALAQSCPLRVEDALFGDAMLDRIAAARLVVNIHRSPDAILETTRVCECLSLGTPVLSEDSIDQGDHPLIESMIRFVPRGDIPAMQAAVAAALADPFQPPDLDAAMQNSADHLRRAMAELGFGLA